MTLQKNNVFGRLISPVLQRRRMLLLAKQEMTVSLGQAHRQDRLLGNLGEGASRAISGDKHCKKSVAFPFPKLRQFA